MGYASNEYILYVKYISGASILRYCSSSVEEYTISQSQIFGLTRATPTEARLGAPRVWKPARGGDQIYTP